MAFINRVAVDYVVVPEYLVFYFHCCETWSLFCTYNYVYLIIDVMFFGGDFFVSIINTTLKWAYLIVIGIIKHVENTN